MGQGACGGNLQARECAAGATQHCRHCPRAGQRPTGHRAGHRTVRRPQNRLDRTAAQQRRRSRGPYAESPAQPHHTERCRCAFDFFQRRGIWSAPDGLLGARTRHHEHGRSRAANHLASSRGVVHVPYKGSAPAVADVIGGQVVFTFPAIPTIQGFVQAGKVKVLAISGDKRSPLMPQVPTFTEVGQKDLNIGAWYAFLAPAQTPLAVVARLNAAVATMLSSQEFVDQQLVPQGMSAMSMTPQQFGQHIKTETERMTRIIQLSGAKVD
ncbi:MAG: hypothetical protein EBV21_01440 [Betaproteobacteria bacterium]|nr:hypothetical protein [Betaproteobacteria bacterium]